MANYVDAEVLKDEICSYKKTGVVSEDLGKYIMLMVRGIGQKYKAPEDHQSDCILKSLKALNYLDCRRKPSWIFNYLTSTIFNHYRRLYVENAKQLGYFEKYCRNEHGVEISEIYWDSI